MRKLKTIDQNEINERIDAIWKAMGIELLDHNSIALDHERTILEIMIKCDGMNIEQVKAIAGGAVHISDKFVNQYFKRLAAWEVYRTHDKKLVMTDNNHE